VIALNVSWTSKTNRTALTGCGLMFVKSTAAAM
jgi:hypothetical protein